MARDQRTRLNAELAHQYNGRKKGAAVTPGRSSLTGELVEEHEPAPPDGAEVEEQELETAEEDLADREPKKSLFELPRKEPSRQPLLSSPFGPQPATPAALAAPAATSTNPKAPRRG